MYKKLINIIPAILSNSKDEVFEMLSVCEGKVDRVQIDILDGLFANNTTVDPIIFSDYKTKLFLDYHLMVKDPASWVEKCIQGKADRIIGQIEMMSDQSEFVDMVTSFDKKVGLAIDIATDVSEIDALVVEDLDVILVMSVKAGFGGQKFQNIALSKIEKLAEIRQNFSYTYTICVDGGISFDNIHQVYESGADEVCIGRILFKGDINYKIKLLLDLF